MTEPEIRVTAEIWEIPGGWRANAYGGPMFEAHDVTVDNPTRAGCEAEFITTWNGEWGTTWTDDQFVFDLRTETP